MIVLLIGYMFLFIHRPFEIWEPLADVRFELVYMLVTGLVWSFFARKQIVGHRIHVAFLFFNAAVLCCWIASPWMGETSVTVENYFKLVVFYVLLVTVVRSEQDLKWIVAAFLVVMAGYMLHSLREYYNGRHEYRMGITRMIGVDVAMGDPNTFGASVLYALPFVGVFWETSPGEGSRSHRLLRCLLAWYALLSVVCIILTGSRSAFLGLLLCGILAIFRSRWRWGILLAALALAPFLWWLIPAEKQLRFETILFPELGPANAQTSADSRIDGLKLGLQLFGDNPITGCGPGAWRQATGALVESHCLYGQVPGELGLVGVLAFLFVVFCLWSTWRKIRAAFRDHLTGADPFLSSVAQAISLAVLLMLVEGFFGHNLFRYNWLWYGGFLVIAHQLVDERVRQEKDACALDA
jgi:O-antigen ligase